MNFLYHHDLFRIKYNAAFAKRYEEETGNVLSRTNGSGETIDWSLIDTNGNRHELVCEILYNALLVDYNFDFAEWLMQTYNLDIWDAKTKDASFLDQFSA